MANKIVSVAISVNTSGDNTIVAAVANRIIRVLGYTIIAAGTVNPTFKSGTGGGATNLTGALPLVANSGVSAALAPFGAGGQTSFHFQTLSGQALNLSLDANVLLAGHLTYEVVN